MHFENFFQINKSEKWKNTGSARKKTSFVTNGMSKPVVSWFHGVGMGETMKPWFHFLKCVMTCLPRDTT